MNDIDLIPTDYRRRRWFERNAKRFGAAVAAVAMITGASYAGLQHATQQINLEIERLQGKEEITVRQRTELSQLTEEKARYESQIRLLEGLRSGISAESMFTTIDRATAGNDVWFVDWEFRRTGVVVEHERDKTEAGHFIVLPSSANGKNVEAWKIETHMSIKGRARDHSALSKFVTRLLAQPEIQDVHVLSSAQRTYKKRRVVEFDLAIVVNTGVVSG